MVHRQYEQFHPLAQLASLVTPGQDASPSAVVLLHGWLDNARSFDVLAAAAQQQGHGSDWIAIDMPGHGRSPWAISANDYMAWGYAAPVAHLIKSLGQPVDLICHSMGTNTGIMLAASHLLAIRSLTLLDGVGPLTDNENTSGLQLQKGLAQALDNRNFAGSRQQSVCRFATIEDAVKKRQQFSQYLSCEELTKMVRRSLIRSEDGFGWGTDPRLRQHSLVRLNEDHVASYCRAIDIPVLVIQANQSILPEKLFQQRLDYFEQVQHKILTGHHHYHMVKSSCGELLETINSFHSRVS